MTLPPNPPRLLDQLRDAIRRKHSALCTEAASVGWVRRFIRFHQLHHPREMGATEVSAFLTHLAVKDAVAALESGPERATLPLPRGAAPAVQCGTGDHLHTTPRVSAEGYSSLAYAANDRVMEC